MSTDLPPDPRLSPSHDLAPIQETLHSPIYNTTPNTTPHSTATVPNSPQKPNRPLPPIPVKVNRERPKSIMVDNVVIDLGNVAGMDTIVFEQEDDVDSDSEKDDE